jgi:hypothetical protein
LDGLIKDIGKDRQHLFFKLAMSVLQLLELLFGCGARAPHAFEEHLNQLISCPNLGLIEKTDQQAVAPSPVKDIVHGVDVKGGGFCRKLLNLRVGNLVQEGPGR